ncbi:MAG: magnesium transporter CorA family protein [Candidatus Paceibacterota bacterium]|jgi:magnesium transporter
MVEIFYKGIKEDVLEKIDSLRDGCWVNIENAKIKDIEFIAEITNLDIPDIEDTLDLYELPRIERENENVILFIRDTQEQDKEDIYTTPLTVIINKKYLITISPGRNKTIRSIIDGKMTFPTTQRSKFLIHFLLLISKNFTKEIKRVKNNVLNQKKGLKKIKGLDITNLIEGEEILNQYISALTPMKTVIEAISKGGYVHLYSNDDDLLEDMIIAIRQSVDNCTVSVKSIKNLRDSYQAIFTNDLNKTIRLLTSLTVILTVPTIVSSVFGMNVPLPLANNSLAFPIVVLLIFFVACIFYFIFKSRDWI